MISNPRLLLLLACLSIPGCTPTLTPTPTSTPTSTPPSNAKLAAWFDSAEKASTGRDLEKARDLYRDVAERDSFDPERRDRAAIQAAFLEWYVFHDAEAARELLSRVPETSRETSASWSELARMETELTRDFERARTAARTAYARAQNLAEKETAILRGAEATIEESRAARLAGRCPQDADALRVVIDALRTTIAAGGPVLDSSRLLLNAALLTNDRATALQAWRWYYADVPGVVPATLGDRRTLGLALAESKLFAEAEIVLRDPCSTDAVDADAGVRDILAYAKALRGIGAVTREHYRAVARGVENDKTFQQAVGAEGMKLWPELSWPAGAPPFSLEAIQKELSQRFGAVISLGDTDDIFNLLMGHKVIDEKRIVEQYGRKAALRFVSLDGMVSSGYMVWATHGRTGTAGWIGSDAIYQIRPMYADGPVRRWRRITDPELRGRRDEEIARETRLDDDRAKESPIRHFRGLNLRLERQASESLIAQLEAGGLSGDALRAAFLERTRLNEFESSIWAHEGRHAIDKTIFGIEDNAELEFRAKISEVVFSAMPRGELGSLLSPIGRPGAHGIANERLMKGVVAWMRTHSSEIAHLDLQMPLLPQLDRLTDDQLRAAFRSMAPLAK